MITLTVPDMALVVLVGASGSGKSTFARAHFAPTQVLSSDAFRAMVSDDENDQSATKPAFDALHHVAGLRLAGGRITVVDATNTRREDRAELIALARAHHVLPVAIVLDLPKDVCVARDRTRTDRSVGADVVARHHAAVRRSVRGLGREGFRRVHVLRSEDDVAAAQIRVEPLLNDLRHETGPFDVIGDVHGCRAELGQLLEELGYALDGDGRGARHPEGRRAVFVGDLVDRGPDTPGVLRLVMGMVAAGDAFCVAGNHEAKLVRALDGRNVRVAHGLAESLAQLAAETDDFRKQVRDFCDGLIAHHVLDGGALVVAHAGLPEAFHGRASGRVREFALYGDTTGEVDEFGLPVRLPWANDYRGRAVVLYGHTPTPDAEWINNTMCLDTGCVFGGALTALRWPEREVVSVPAVAVHTDPVRPLAPPPEPEREPHVLDLADVTGKRVVETAHLTRITVAGERAAAALEVMSRFAVDPRWLPYLPPTMAPVASSGVDGYLEHPAEAFSAYAKVGVTRVVCEEKHMGSRAVVLVCRDPSVAPARFGVAGDGVVVTRTGRAFLPGDRQADLLDRLRRAAGTAGLWDELGDWLLLDAELLPWNAKAGELIRGQYAQLAAAGRAGLGAAADVLATAAARGLDVGDLAAAVEHRRADVDAYRDAYRRYVGPDDAVQLAPFQVLAAGAADGAGRTFHDRPHDWHLGVADRLHAADPELIRRTESLVVDTGDAGSVRAGVDWWLALTGAGGEGAVVKPLANLVRGPKGLVQPGTKVRGREYLRLIYGADYLDRLPALRQRRLNPKRALALREYALGIESLERFARGEPLWRVHECVFAVLALESEPVDPRL